MRVTGYESLPTEEGWGEAGRPCPVSWSRRIRKSQVKILPLLHSAADLALTSGVTIRKDVNLLYCMQPSFTAVNLTPLHKYLLFCPIQILITLIMGTVYLKKQFLSLSPPPPSSSLPQKRLLSDGQQLQTSGTLKTHSLPRRVLWDSGHSPVLSFVLLREAWENSDY